MPTPTDHYHEAERLLDQVEAGGGDDVERQEWLTAAQVHATLATVRPDDVDRATAALQVTK